MAVFPTPTPLHMPVAMGMLPQKRKPEGLPADSDEPQCVPTSHIRPGGANVLAASSPQASALNLRLGAGAALVPPAAAAAKGAKVAQDEEGGPLAVDVSGFGRSDLNVRYSARQDMVISGRRSYWTSEATSELSRRFLVFQKALSRWAICERANVGPGDQIEASEEAEFCGSFCPWLAFQLDQAHFLEPCRWMERSESGWIKVDGVSMAPAPSAALAPPKAPATEPRALAVEFTGFRRLELNSKFNQRLDVVVQGKPSYWDASSRLFVYWQNTLRRWAICSKRSLDEARRGQTPGCAVQLDQVHFSLPSRWVEYQDQRWVSVPVEVVAHLPPPASEPEDGAKAAGSTEGPPR